MNIHIGKVIKSKWRISEIKISDLAKTLNTTPRNIYSIFARDTITIDRLLAFSKALKFDFFEFYLMKSEPLTFLTPNKKNPGGLKNKTRISIVIELDGTEDTAEAHIKKIRQLNAIIQMP